MSYICLFLSTPSARRATEIEASKLRPDEFLSTPSARRATFLRPHPAAPPSYFYPRPPRGGRPGVFVPQRDAAQFLSTPSARRATSVQYPDHQGRTISIHALREEGDRSSSGVRKSICLFLSTPSARRATEGPDVTLSADKFLSTPSARRATRAGAQRRRPYSNFYPRPPRGGRRVVSPKATVDITFLSTPSARRATQSAHAPADAEKFLSTPSARRATTRKFDEWRTI